jgi:hypothetical protein
MTIQEEILKLENEYNIEAAELSKRCGGKWNISMNLEQAKKMLEENFNEGYLKILKERLHIIREFKNRENFKAIEELESAKDY